MSISLTELAADIAEMITDMSDTVVLQDGQTITGMAEGSNHSQTLEENGFMEQADFVFYGRKSSFTAAPQVNMKLTHSATSKQYRILRVGVDPSNLLYTLTCVELTK